MRVLVNAAISLDGKLALAGGRPLRLSSEEDIARVHRLRADVEAILVGSGTAIADDPSLLVQPAYAPGAKQPARVVLDGRGRLPPSLRLFDGAARTIVYTTKRPPPPWPHAEVRNVASLREGTLDARAVLADLGALDVRSVLVEGGGHVIRSFLEAGLVDEFTLYVAPVLVGNGAPSLFEGEGASDARFLRRLKLLSAKPLSEGVLLAFDPRG